MLFASSFVTARAKSLLKEMVLQCFLFRSILIQFYIETAEEISKSVFRFIINTHADRITTECCKKTEKIFSGKVRRDVRQFFVNNFTVKYFIRIFRKKKQKR